MEVDIPPEVAEIARQKEESVRAAELLEAELKKEKAKEKDDPEVIMLDVEVHRQKEDDDDNGDDDEEDTED